LENELYEVMTIRGNDIRGEVAITVPAAEEVNGTEGVGDDGKVIAARDSVKAK
jgi:hypothetical protein